MHLVEFDTKFDARSGESCADIFYNMQEQRRLKTSSRLRSIMKMRKRTVKFIKE